MNDSHTQFSGARSRVRKFSELPRSEPHLGAFPVFTFLLRSSLVQQPREIQMVRPDNCPLVVLGERDAAQRDTIVGGEEKRNAVYLPLARCRCRGRGFKVRRSWTGANHPNPLPPKRAILMQLEPLRHRQVMAFQADRFGALVDSRDVCAVL